MPSLPVLARQKSRLGVLLDHFAAIEDSRDVRRIAHPLAEILLLVVCATMADCDDYDHIAAWGEAHLDFLRRHLPYEHGTPGLRWLSLMLLTPISWAHRVWALPFLTALASSERYCQQRGRRHKKLTD